MKENTKWGIGITIALLGAGGGIAGWKGLFDCNKNSDFSIIGKWAPKTNQNVGCKYIIFHIDEDGRIEGNCDSQTHKHNLKGMYLNNKQIKVAVSRKTLSTQCVTKTSGNLQIIDKNTMNYTQEGWDGCDTKDLKAGAYTLERSY